MTPDAPTWSPLHRVEMMQTYRESLLDLLVLHAVCPTCRNPVADTRIRTVAAATYRTLAQLGEAARTVASSLRGTKLSCCSREIAAAAASYHAYHSGRQADLVARFEYGLFGVSGPRLFWWAGETGYRAAEALDAGTHQMLARDAAVRSIAVQRETGGGIRAASAAIQAALSEIPGDPALLALLPSLLSVGNGALGRNIIDAHLARFPEDAEGHFWDGELKFILVQSGAWADDKLPLAEASLQRALRLKPDHFGAQITLASIERLFGDEKVALAIYVKLIQTSPQSAVPHYNLASLVLASDPARALQHFQAGERLDPKDPDFPIGCARALVLLNRRPEAAQALERGVRLAPNHPRIAELRTALLR